LTQEARRTGLGRAAIEADLEIIQAQLARLPTRPELAQTAPLTTLTEAAVVSKRCFDDRDWWQLDRWTDSANY
jgi:hypothetical protein